MQRGDALATRRAERDPIVDLKGALPPVKHKHYATITYPSDVSAPQIVAWIRGMFGV